MGRLGRPSPSPAPAERARAPQRGARLVHRFTVLPRWTQEPASGVSEYDERIPDTLVAALHQWASAMGVPFASVLLAAHAKVMGALSGERDVRVGYVAESGDRPSAIELSL